MPNLADHTGSTNPERLAVILDAISGKLDTNHDLITGVVSEVKEVRTSIAYLHEQYSRLASTIDELVTRREFAAKNDTLDKEIARTQSLAAEIKREAEAHIIENRSALDEHRVHNDAEFKRIREEIEASKKETNDRQNRRITWTIAVTGLFVGPAASLAIFFLDGLIRH